MSLTLRIGLIVAAVVLLVCVLVKIRRSQFKTADSIFWFLFAACLVIAAVFPQLPITLSVLVGIESPANFVFLCIVAVLLVKEFRMSLAIASLKSKLAQMAQSIALDE